MKDPANVPTSILKIRSVQNSGASSFCAAGSKPPEGGSCIELHRALSIDCG